MQSQKIIQGLEQRLRLNQQTLQIISLMPLNLTELRARVEEEVERNPALEILSGPSDLSLENLRRESRVYEDRFQKSQGTSSGLRQTRDDFIEATVASQEDLYDHLLEQLHLQRLEPEERRLGELLINNLDHNGFHREEPGNLSSRPQDGPLLEKIMALIQGFDPLGCCTRDYRESLLVQARLRPDFPKGLGELLEKHWDMVLVENRRALSRKLRVPLDEINAWFELLGELHPFPGRLYGSPPVQYIVPVAEVYCRGGEVILNMREEEIPVLGLDPFFSQESEDEALPKEARRFAQQRVTEAQRFIEDIRRWQSTLEQVCRVLVEKQREFFLKGPKFLQPMAQKDMAELLERHESTISRITNGKYLQSEWGLFELKYFFSAAVGGSQGEGDTTRESIKEMIKEMVDSHAGSKKLTDQKLTDLLAERGINIARRTVAKYRNELSAS